MITRSRAVIAGLAALTTLVAIVVGLPVVLYKFGGSPLPRRVPGWHWLLTALGSADSGALLLAAVRDCAWLGWLLFTAAVLMEALAALRGGRVPRLWLGGVQSLAARLVALAAVTFAAPATVTLTASAAMASATQHVPAGDPLRHALLLAASAGLKTDASANQGSVLGQTNVLGARSDGTPATRIVTVRPGDCLWGIAQRYLGAGDRYPEIASLNYGREMGGGEVFTNPSLIEPGWQLILPSATVASPIQPGNGATYHVGHSTSDELYRRRHAGATNRPAGAGTESVAAQPTGGPGRPASLTGGAGRHASAAGASGRVGHRRGGSSPAGQFPQAVTFVTGALAGSVLTSLSRLRLRQRQERRRGRRIALPADGAALLVEQKLRAAAPVEPAPTLRDALAWLEACMASAGQPLPEIVGLHVTPIALEVLLSAPAPESPPSPFAITPGRQGMCWQLDLPLAAETLFRPVGDEGLFGSVSGNLLPSLVTVGATSDGYLLLDLEALRVTACDGPADLVDRVIAAAASELAVCQWGGCYELILVGCGEFEVLGRAEHFDTVDEALALLESRAEAVTRRLAALGEPDQSRADVREMRLASPDDEDWGVTIFVSRVEPSPDQMSRLLQLAEDGPGGLAALVGGDPESPDGRMAPAVLQLAPDPQAAGGIVANVVPLQIAVRPETLSPAEYEALATLFAVAAETADVSAQDEPYACYEAPPWIPQTATMGAGRPAAVPYPAAGAAEDVNEARAEGAGQTLADAYPLGLDLPGADEAGHLHLASARWPVAPAEPELPADPGAEPQSDPQHATGHLKVKILGPFSIDGSAEQLHPKPAELVLALALAAPSGLPNSALCSILGADPDHPKPPDAIRQLIMRTRRRLGHADDGREYIIHTGNGSYALHPDVALDWSEFRDLVASGRTDDLRAAMSLIRGQPFNGSYFWWIDIPLLETVRAEVVDAAETLAEREMAAGSARGAARAARAGLAAEAAAEQLWRILMRAEHAAGNLAGVTEAWRRCLDAIADIAPDGEPHPDTAALYHQLTQRRLPVRG